MDKWITNGILVVISRLFLWREKHNNNNTFLAQYNVLNMSTMRYEQKIYSRNNNFRENSTFEYDYLKNKKILTLVPRKIKYTPKGSLTLKTVPYVYVYRCSGERSMRMILVISILRRIIISKHQDWLVTTWKMNCNKNIVHIPALHSQT